MNVANLVILHVNAAYGLVLEALAVEDAAAAAVAGVQGTAVVVAAAAQDTGGAQAMVEARGIVLQRGAATAGRHHQLVHEATADHLHLLVSEATADHQHSQPTARSPPTQITRNPPSSNLLEMLGGLGVFL